MHIHTCTIESHKCTTNTSYDTQNSHTFSTSLWQPHPQHVCVSLLGCPVDSRPAILVGGAHVTFFTDESLHSISLSPHRRQEEGRHRVLVYHFLVTSPALNKFVAVKNLCGWNILTLNNYWGGCKNVTGRIIRGGSTLEFATFKFA